VISARLRAAGALLVVFALGAATGSAATHYRAARSLHHFLDAPPSEARRKAIVWALDHHLSLSSEQRTQIEAILAAHSPELTAIARRNEPELSPIMDRMQDEMRATLTPRQQAKFDSLTTHFRDRRRRALGLDGP
jgi:Spy/CpxP family protein refolding chaperone